MAKLTNSQTLQATHRPAAKIEVRMARSFVRANKRLSREVSQSALVAALSAGNVRAAQDLFPISDIADAYAPTAAIIHDAFLRGGRIGLAQAAPLLEDPDG